MKKLSIILLVCIIAVFCMTEISFLQERTRRGGESLFGDVKAYKIGDVITIIINENAQASNVANIQTDKQNQMSMDADFGKFIGRLTGELSSDTRNSYRGSGQTASQGRFTATVAARIIEITQDGNFLIRGSKEVETNGEKVTTVVSGIIRSEDLTPTNTIYSYQIADAQIFHEGKGVVKQGNRPGIFTRVINWIF